eukprot:552184_1
MSLLDTSGTEKGESSSNKSKPKPQSLGRQTVECRPTEHKPDNVSNNEITSQSVAENDNKSTTVDENKEIIYDSDDGQQEVQVNQHDLREKAFGCSIKDTDIISCIGKIRSTFITSDNSTKTCVGTGTVYKFIDSYAYIITCAHNLRFTEYWKCNQCKQKNEKRKCLQCNTNNTTAHVIKAGKVYFQRRKLQNGNVQHEYKCDSEIVYIQDDKYCQLPLAKSGYDIAIIKFKDESNYYKSICQNILLVDGRVYHSIRDKLDSYYIYGYPARVVKNPVTDENKPREEMWGAESIKDTFKCELNEYNNGQWFLKQSEIDASSGMSGSAIFSIYPKYTLIFGIHTGGSLRFKYNVGTLLDDKVPDLKVHAAKYDTIKTVNDLILITSCCDGIIPEMANINNDNQEAKVQNDNQEANVQNDNVQKQNQDASFLKNKITVKQIIFGVSVLIGFISIICYFTFSTKPFDLEKEFYNEMGRNIMSKQSFLDYKYSHDLIQKAMNSIKLK